MHRFFSLLTSSSFLFSAFTLSAHEEPVQKIHIYPSSLKDQSFITLTLLPKNSIDATQLDLKQYWNAYLFQSLLKQHLKDQLSSGFSTHVFRQSDAGSAQITWGISLSASAGQMHATLKELLAQIKEIKTDGFTLEELHFVKQNAHQYLSQLNNHAMGDVMILASHSEENPLDHESSAHLDKVVSLSHELIENINLQEILEYSQAQLIQAQQEVHIVASEVDNISENEVMGLLEEQKLPIENENSIEVASQFALAHMTSNVNVDALEANGLPIVDQEPSREEGSHHFIAFQRRLAAPNTVLNEPNFYAQLPISSEEKKLISKLLISMAENNVFKLLFEKKKLERIGKRINNVHPMRFLGTVFTDHQLIRCMNEIKKSSFKWDGFISGFANRMQDEANQNNLQRYVAGFAQSVNLTPSDINAYLDRRDFEGLVKFLISAKL